MVAFRFGIQMRTIDGGSQWREKCRRAEQLGYDVITVPDHLGALGPAPALAAAAAVTEQIRLGQLVLNVPFHNTALLARDVATLDQLSDGRIEVGLGAGHRKSEFDDAGIPWEGAAARIARLARAVVELRDRLAGDHRPEPVQAPVPLLVAGNSDGVLSLAARYGDIVGFAGLRQAPGQPPGRFHLTTAEQLDERVAAFDGFAGKRSSRIERNMLLQHVEITEDRRAAVTRLRTAVPHLNLDVDELLDAPQLLVGTRDEMVERVRSLRQRYGFTYLTVFEPAMEQFAGVIKAVRS